MLRYMSIAAIAALFTASASAQVFVIGSGLGGDCFQKTKNTYHSFRSAEETCTRALREETMTRANRAATYVNRGVLRMREGLYSEAIDDYQKALDIQSELGAAYLNRGAAHIYQKQFSDALQDLNRAIELQSEDLFAAYYNRAIAKENTGDVPGAYMDFQKALELKPNWQLAEKQLSRFRLTPDKG